VVPTGAVLVHQPSLSIQAKVARQALTGEPEEDWLFETNGAGIMVAEPKVFGRVYLHAPHEEEDLHFVGRAE
jgi:hypothetical protein